MKSNNKFWGRAIACLVVSGCLFIAFLFSNDFERERFENFTRSTVPNDDLEQIKSPTSITLSFDKFFHLDMIHWRDKYGRRVLDVSTKCLNSRVLSNPEEVDTGYISVDNYGMLCPYSFPMDDSTVYKIRVMEFMAGCNYNSWKNRYAPTDKSWTSYIEWGLPEVFCERVYTPLLRELFDNLLYIRAESPLSIVKAVRLNKVGTVSCVFLYNGMMLDFDKSLGSTLQQSYRDLFQTSISSESREKLVESYERRLSFNSMLNYRDEAESLSFKHVKEIEQTLCEEDVELLGVQGAGWNNISAEDFKKTVYPEWISWLQGLGLFFLGLSLIFAILAYRNKE